MTIYKLFKNYNNSYTFHIKTYNDIVTIEVITSIIPNIYFFYFLN